MSAQYFPGIITEELKRVGENRELRNPDTVLIHVGTNSLRRKVNLVCYG
jgi:hypothetical protein